MNKWELLDFADPGGSGNSWCQQCEKELNKSMGKRELLMGRCVRLPPLAQACGCWWATQGTAESRQVPVLFQNSISHRHCRTLSAELQGPSLSQSSFCGTGHLKLEHKPNKPGGHWTGRERDKELVSRISHVLLSTCLKEMDWISLWGWLFLFLSLEGASGSE